MPAPPSGTGPPVDGCRGGPGRAAPAPRGDLAGRPPAGGAQAAAGFGSEGVGDQPPVAMRPGGAAGSAQQERAGVGGTGGAQPAHFQGGGVVQAAGDRAAHDHHPHQLAVAGGAEGELPALDPTGVAVVAGHEPVGRREQDRQQLEADMAMSPWQPAQPGWGRGGRGQPPTPTGSLGTSLEFARPHGFLSLVNTSTSSWTTRWHGSPRARPAGLGELPERRPRHQPPVADRGVQRDEVLEVAEPGLLGQPDSGGGKVVQPSRPAGVLGHHDQQPTRSQQPATAHQHLSDARPPGVAARMAEVGGVAG
jgi:hypothetical protein